MEENLKIKDPYKYALTIFFKKKIMLGGWL